MKIQKPFLEQLVRDHYQSLYRFALSLARNETEAADLTQQTFLLLANKGGQIREPGKARSWLFTTLRREFYRMRTEMGRFTAIEDEEREKLAAPEDVETEYFKRANAVQIMEAMQEVQEVFRVPLALFYFEDFTYREIAEITDVPEGTVMSRLSRGRSELKTILTQKLKFEGLAGNVIPLRAADGSH